MCIHIYTLYTCSSLSLSLYLNIYLSLSLYLSIYLYLSLSLYIYIYMNTCTDYTLQDLLHIVSTMCRCEGGGHGGEEVPDASDRALAAEQSGWTRLPSG